MSHTLSEGWGSRSASGTWDEIADAQQKDLSSLVRLICIPCCLCESALAN